MNVFKKWLFIFTDQETQAVLSEKYVEHPGYCCHYHSDTLYSVWHISDNSGRQQAKGTTR